MKALIVDILDKHVIVLDKKGNYLKIKNYAECQVGSKIDLKPQRLVITPNIFKILPIAAVFILFIGLGLSAYAYSLPYTYVNVDINPSVQITANMIDRIIKIEGINADGKKLIADNKLINCNLIFGIEEILNDAENNGYLKNIITNAVLITVSGKQNEKVDKIEAQVQKTAEKNMSNSNIASTKGTESDNSAIEIFVEKVTLERHDEAIKQGISPGKNDSKNESLNTKQNESNGKENLKENTDDKNIKKEVDGKKNREFRFRQRD